MNSSGVKVIIRQLAKETMAVEAQVVDLEQAEDVGFYYSYQGGLQLRPSPDDGERPPGSCAVLAACSKYGLVFWSDLQGA